MTDLRALSPSAGSSWKQAGNRPGTRKVPEDVQAWEQPQQRPALSSCRHQATSRAQRSTGGRRSSDTSSGLALRQDQTWNHFKWLSWSIFQLPLMEIHSTATPAAPQHSKAHFSTAVGQVLLSPFSAHLNSTEQGLLFVRASFV